MRKLLIKMTLTTVFLAVSLCNLAEELHTYGPTTKEDHLWYIAQSVRPSREVSKQQTMVAILKANPEAFNSNNVNALRSGYTLTIPSLATIKAIPSLSALVEVSAQNIAWTNRVDFEPRTAKRGVKPPPFGALKRIKPTPADTANKATVSRSEKSVEASPQPVGVPAAQRDNPQTNFSQLSAVTLAVPGLKAPSQSLSRALATAPLVLSTLLPHESHSTLAASQPPTAPETAFITAATAEALIRKGVATHISQLAQKLDDFLLRINEIDRDSQQRLEIVEGEQVVMKNQIASLDKQMQQLRENYLDYSTPIIHRSAFSEYGFWIMGGSVLACLLVLIFTLSRRRPLPAVSPTQSTSSTPLKPNVAEETDEIEDEYDYLGSREGVAAKLDLARAYIDMGDTAQASLVLHEVIAQGSDEQRFAARQMLSHITQDTVH